MTTEKREEWIEEASKILKQTGRLQRRYNKLRLKINKAKAFHLSETAAARLILSQNYQAAVINEMFCEVFEHMDDKEVERAFKEFQKGNRQ